MIKVEDFPNLLVPGTLFRSTAFSKPMYNLVVECVLGGPPRMICYTLNDKGRPVEPWLRACTADEALLDNPHWELVQKGSVPKGE